MNRTEENQPRLLVSENAEHVIPLLSLEEEEKISKSETPDTIPILPLRNTVLFPGVVIPITVGRDKSIQLVKDAYAQKLVVGVCTQIDNMIDDPSENDLYKTGTTATILRMLRMPDGTTTIIIQGNRRFLIESFTQYAPYHKAKVQTLADIPVNKDAEEIKALQRSVKEMATQLIHLSPHIPTESTIAVQNIDSFTFLIHFVSSNLNLKVDDKQKILEENDVKKRGDKVVEYLGKELQVAKLSEEISSKVRGDIEKQQRDFFLRQQMKTIQTELGDEGLDAEAKEFKERAKKKKWSKAVQDVFDKELGKIQRAHPSSPEYGVSMNYLEWLLDLPWGEYTADNFDLKQAMKILDRDHYGLEKVKERILEYLAVLKMKKDMKAPILCFAGPPGVGKTSLGKSIAEALGRKFVRMSLGGIRDEAEIRGHRRTYIGSLPGRIIQGLKKAASGNPVYMLDEIDKVGFDYHGDPASALLEVLDPEQNKAFNDHYLEVDYDLSKVLFIATANTLETIHPALRDRIEVIEINGYTTEEKIQIAKKYLVPKQLKEHGLAEVKSEGEGKGVKKNNSPLSRSLSHSHSVIQFEDKAIEKIIESYTRESGVRNLERNIASVCRKVAKEIAMDKKPSPKVSAKAITQFLGAEKFENDIYEQVNIPGVAVGLAWTPVGGDILFIEAKTMPGKGEMKLTGQLGDVMKESASAALSFIKSNASELKISQEKFEKNDLHIHVPAGAVPKDGPSAGITMLTAIVSVLTGRKVKKGIAMTGEITLRGKVLPVGGIKEKILAAKRAGITNIIMCEKNKRDVEEIKKEFIRNLKIHYVKNMKDALTEALEK